MLPALLRPSMKIRKRKDGWWIIEVPECEDCGPYDTKAMAEEDMKGLERTERWGHLKTFWNGKDSI